MSELKPAIEIALAVMNESSPARIEGLVRADRLAVIDRCIADILALDSKLICDAKGKVLGGSFKRFAPMVDRNMVFAALEKLKEEV